MNIAQKIDRANVLQRRIAIEQEELDGLEAEIESYALGHASEHSKLQEADRDGTQFIAVGTEVRVPILFTADNIMGSFAPGTLAHTRVQAAAGDKFPLFYKKVTSFKCAVKDDGHKYRALVRAHMLPADAAKVIDASLSRDTAGVPKSKTVFAWDRAEQLTGVTA